MTVTVAELEAFCRYSEHKINEKAACSLGELAELWEAQESVAELYRAIPDILSGCGHTIAEVDARIREKRSWIK